MTPPQEKGVDAGRGSVYVFLQGTYVYISIGIYLRRLRDVTDIHRYAFQDGAPEKGRRVEARESEENKKMVVQQYRKRARSTKESRHRLRGGRGC